MRTKRVATGSLLIAGMLGGSMGGGLVGTAGAQEPASLIRCEADFLGFMVGSANDAIHSGCEDLTAAYQAGVATYQQRNAECDAISRIAHPIKRTECEAGAKWDGISAFRATAKPLREAAPPATTAPASGSSGSALSDGVNAVTKMVEAHPAAALGVGLGAATLAIPATRAAAFAAGGSITGLLGKLVNVIKAPFAAAARALT